MTASHPKNTAFAATSVAPSSLWSRRVATAATRYTPTGNNPHTKKTRCQREVRRSRPDQGRGHQQRPWTSAGQSEQGRQHAQRHRRPEEQDRPEIHHKSTICRTGAVQRQQLAENLVVGDVRRRTVRGSHRRVGGFVRIGVSISHCRRDWPQVVQPSVPLTVIIYGMRFS